MRHKNAFVFKNISLKKRRNVMLFRKLKKRKNSNLPILEINWFELIFLHPEKSKTVYKTKIEKN